jgi:hypothetical protein
MNGVIRAAKLQRTDGTSESWKGSIDLGKHVRASERPELLPRERANEVGIREPDWRAIDLKHVLHPRIRFLAEISVFDERAEVEAMIEPKPVFVCNDSELP